MNTPKENNNTNDSLLQQRLQDILPTDVPELLWNNIEKEIPMRRKKRLWAYVPSRRLLAAMFIGIVIGVGSSWFFRFTTEQNIPVLTTLLDKNNPHTPIIDKKENNNIVYNKEISVSASSKENREVYSPENRNKVNSVDDNNGSRGDGLPSPYTIVKESPINIEQRKAITPTPVLIPVITFDEKIHQINNTAISIPQISVGKKAKRPINLIASFSPLTAVAKSLLNEKNAYAEFGDYAIMSDLHNVGYERTPISQQQGFSFATGVQVHQPLNEKWEIGGELSFRQLKNRLEYEKQIPLLLVASSVPVPNSQYKTVNGQIADVQSEKDIISSAFLGGVTARYRFNDNWYLRPALLANYGIESQNTSLTTTLGIGYEAKIANKIPLAIEPQLMLDLGKPQNNIYRKPSFLVGINAKMSIF